MDVVNYYLGDEPGPQRGVGDRQGAPPAPEASGIAVRFGGAPGGTVAAAGRLMDMPVNGRVLDVTA